MTTAWEYRQLVIDPDADPEMDELGCKGWELVTVITCGAALIAYFKRPLPGPEPL